MGNYTKALTNPAVQYLRRIVEHASLYAKLRTASTERERWGEPFVPRLLLVLAEDTESSLDQPLFQLPLCNVQSILLCLAEKWDYPAVHGLYQVANRWGLSVCGVYSVRDCPYSNETSIIHWATLSAETEHLGVSRNQHLPWSVMGIRGRSSTERSSRLDSVLPADWQLRTFPVREEVARLVERYKDEKVSITVTGASLGASMATLNATDMAVNPFKPDIPVTAFLFASPKVGDENFKNAFASQPNLRGLRITDVKDNVPTLPPFGLPVGSEGGFQPQGDFDIAKVNKYQDALKDEYNIPVAWWNIKDTGMVQQDDGSYLLDDHEPDEKF
nr:phospholipase A1-II 4-like [Ipomoea batatas]